MASEHDSPPSQCVPAAPSMVATPDPLASSSAGAARSVVATPNPGASISPPLVSLLRKTRRRPIGLRNPTPSMVATPDPQASSSAGAAPSVVATPDPGASISPPLVSLLRKSQRGPIGLRNPTESSCYLNSVLQCLTITPPLAEYCRREVHSTTCRDLNCTLCILVKRIRKSLESTRIVGTPKNLSRLVTNSILFEPGRQEDAHELLNFLIDRCGQAVETHLGNGKSVLHKLFGGVLQNQIVCQECNTTSTRHEEMLGLTLSSCNWGSLEKLESLEEALASFFRQENLDGDNKYDCKGCNRLSDATKRISIYEMPKVLTIHLQRFDPVSGNKLAHFVRFNLQLSVAEYSSQKVTDVPELAFYKLYAVIEHTGDSPYSGHYHAVVKETNGTWYLCDDEKVKELKEELLLEAYVYLLFYIRSDVTENDYL